MNCLYAKIFDNNKMYIGITNNFDRRMYEHQRDAYCNNSQLAVHRAMRKHNHTTEIWSYGVEDRDVLNQLEIQTIQQLKDFGILLYNMTEGGECGSGAVRSQETRDKISNSLKSLCLKGADSVNAKTMKYFEGNPVFRGNFKRTCKTMGWDFNNFEESFSCWHYRTDCQREKKFVYRYVGDANDS